MHLSIDIETLGSGDDAAILQLSAVAFELNGAVLDPHELLQFEDRWFDAVVAPYGGSTSPSNVDFWRSPAAAVARERIASRPEVDIDTVLESFSAFAKRWLGKRGMVWAKPPGFDLRIIRGNIASLSAQNSTLACPWARSQERCVSTLIWTASRVPRVNFKVPNMDVGLVKHYALHDALHQAIVMQSAFRALGLHTLPE